MRVLHIIECGIGGGTIEFVHYLIKYQKSFNHTVICGHRAIEGWKAKIKDTQAEVNDSRVQIIEWKNAHREISLIDDTKALVELHHIVGKLNFDVVMLHSSKAGFLGRLLFFFTGFKNVIYVPNGVSFLRSDVGTAKKQVFIWLEKIASWLSGKVICTSKSEAESMLQHKIPASFIFNGADLPKYSFEESRNAKFTIVTVGRVCFQKNPKMFKEIASAFVSNPNVEFVWVGDGDADNEDISVIASPNIRCTGWVTKNEVYSYVSKADLYISTSLWEGLPFAVIEAMNLRRPLLLHRCVGNVDMVHEDKNGFIYDTVDEAVGLINQMMSDPAKLKQMGEMSYEISSNHFSAKLMSEKYESAYSLV